MKKIIVLVIAFTVILLQVYSQVNLSGETNIKMETKLFDSNKKHILY